MRNPYLRTLIPLALVCTGTDAIPLSGNDGSLTPMTPRQTPLSGCPGQDGPGIMLSNKGSKEQEFYFFKNTRNGNAWADPSFKDPDPEVPAVTVGPGETKYVKIASSWKGRVQRGKEQPATWGEFQLQDTDNDGRQADGAAHGNISLIQGCDGAAEIASTDGTNVRNGITKDCREGAPPAAIEKKPDGLTTLGRLVQNWEGSNINPAAVTWAMNNIDGTKAYMLGPDGKAASSGVPDIASKNNCLEFDFY